METTSETQPATCYACAWNLRSHQHTCDRFVLVVDGRGTTTHATKEAAIAFGRSMPNVLAFEVYDENDRQVFSQRPESRWA